MKWTFPLLVCLAAMPFVGCAVDATDSTPSEESDRLDLVGALESKSTTQYIAINDFWKTPEEQDQWWTVMRKMRTMFDDRCGDTWCESDYTNLSSFGFDCSVSSVRGNVHQCKWTMAGSSHLVNPKLGNIATDAPHWECKFEFKNMTAKKLSDFLNNASTGIDSTIPGMTKSIYETLTDCFQNNAIGHTQLPSYPYGDNDKYVDVGNDTTSVGVSWDDWFALRDKMVYSFDQVCGDTFCEGDYSNMEPLKLVCSAVKATGQLKGCTWYFFGSYNQVTASTGNVAVHPKNYACQIPVNSTAAAFVQAINGTTGDPLQTTIPGTSATIYDALMNCL